MNTLTIDPRFIPAQLNLMRARRPRRHRDLRERMANWLKAWAQTMVAELVALGAGLERAL